MLLPINVKAQKEEKIEYQKIVPTALYRPSDELVEKLRIEALPKPQPIVKKTNYAANYACFCAWYLQVKYGIPKTPKGYAGSYKVGSLIPSASGFVLTRESALGHIAHYTLVGKNLLLDDEANYKTCRVTHTRILPVSSPLIRGYL